MAGTATIGYSDGTTQVTTLGFSDWTLGGGSRTPRPGTAIVSSMPYRNQGLLGGQEQVRTYVFAATLAIDPAKTVVSLTLPPAVTVDGIRYTWPTVAAGGRDNHRAAGQRISVTATAGATKVGLLGASTGLPNGVSGTATLTYTDGTQQSVSVGFSDWTLGNATATIGYGNVVAAQMAYRNSAQYGRDTTATYVFAVKVPLAAGKTLQAVTLPSILDGTMHVFAIATG